MVSQQEAFRFLIPEMSTVSDADLTQALAIASLHLNLDILPDEVQGLALVYKAASILYERNRNATSSNASTAEEGTFISSKREGNLEIQYKQLDGSLAVTSNNYEKMLMSLMPVGGFIITRFGLPTVT